MIKAKINHCKNLHCFCSAGPAVVVGVTMYVLSISSLSEVQMVIDKFNVFIELQDFDYEGWWREQIVWYIQVKRYLIKEEPGHLEWLFWHLQNSRRSFKESIRLNLLRPTFWLLFWERSPKEGNYLTLTFPINYISSSQTLRSVEKVQIQFLNQAKYHIRNMWGFWWN